MSGRDQRLSVGLVGCGYWGINLCRVLAQHPATRLVAVCDQRPEATQRARVLAPGARHHRSLDAFLSDRAVEAVVIATPVHSHHSIVMAALRSGRPVLVEKPLSRTVEEGAAMCAEATTRGLTLMVGHTFLYNNAVRQVKAMIDGGELGDIRYVFCRRLNLGVVRQDVDVLWDLGSHDVSMLQHWIDRPVVRANAFGHSFLQPGIDDVVFGHLTFEDNITGHFQVSWVDPAKVRQATVVGSRKMLIYDDMAADARIAVYDKGIDAETIDRNLGTFETFAEHQLRMRAGDVWLPRIEFPEPRSPVQRVPERDPVAQGVAHLGEAGGRLCQVEVDERCGQAVPEDHVAGAVVGVAHQFGGHRQRYRGAGQRAPDGVTGRLPSLGGIVQPADEATQRDQDLLVCTLRGQRLRGHVARDEGEHLPPLVVRTERDGGIGEAPGVQVAEVRLHRGGHWPHRAAHRIADADDALGDPVADERYLGARVVWWTDHGRSSSLAHGRHSARGVGDALLPERGAGRPERQYPQHAG